MLGIDHCCNESTGWMMIKDRKKTNDLLLCQVSLLLTKSLDVVGAITLEVPEVISLFIRILQCFHFFFFFFK